MRLIKGLFFLLLLFFLFFSLFKGIINYQDKIQFYQNYKKEYEKEKKRHQQLQTEMIKKKSLEQLEKTIRNKLNLLKEDEVALLLPSPTPSSDTPTPTPSANWFKWWQVFFR